MRPSPHIAILLPGLLGLPNRMWNQQRNGCKSLEIVRLLSRHSSFKTPNGVNEILEFIILVVEN